MLPKMFEFNILKSLGISVGMALLLGPTGAIASPRPLFISQANSSSRPPVVVDTDSSPGGRPTTPNSTSGSSGRVSSSTRFGCQLDRGQYTVMYQPESQPSKYFPWAVPSALGGGWDPQKRCYEIARRLESYRPDGLQELTTGVENGYNTVCVTTQAVPQCRIVFTVPPGQDPTTTRDRVFENLTIADSGQQTEGVPAYRGGGNEIEDLVNMGRGIFGGGKKPQAGSGSINLRPFLDKADGGTGRQLNGGVSKNTKFQLNPGSFR